MSSAPPGDARVGIINTASWAPLRVSSAASSLSRTPVCCASRVLVRSVTRACGSGIGVCAMTFADEPARMIAHKASKVTITLRRKMIISPTTRRATTGKTTATTAEAAATAKATATEAAAAPAAGTATAGKTAAAATEPAENQTERAHADPQWQQAAEKPGQTARGGTDQAGARRRRHAAEKRARPETDKQGRDQAVDR